MSYYYDVNILDTELLDISAPNARYVHEKLNQVVGTLFNGLVEFDGFRLVCEYVIPDYALRDATDRGIIVSFVREVDEKLESIEIALNEIIDKANRYGYYDITKELLDIKQRHCVVDID